ncbi:universal stress protein (plasmid) [Priestia megaterium]|uniref:Universal stress protein n=1 Tax=Priestia flexa TaxID=86664 RepID=A0ABU4J4Z8_9BACI|nr:MULTISPECIES: universal stress protein [Priestia]MCW1048884.1 universal stress protein [Priestia sp. JV24]MDW8516067.1 universal stress protein [Priestia flexa]QSF42109.1 universal stress protein [Priestia megaterium]
MYRKILLAVDGSEHSKRAAKHAIELALLVKDSTIQIINVIGYSQAKTEVLHEELKEERQKILSEVEELFQKGNISYEMKIERGETGPTIVEYANKEVFDLLVIGSRGLNPLQEMVLGSVSHKVAKRAECPVLIIK